MSSVAVFAYNAFMSFDRMVLSRAPRPLRSAAYLAAVKIKDRMFRPAVRGGLAIDNTDSGAGLLPRTGTARKLPDWLREETIALRKSVDPSLFCSAPPSPSPQQFRFPAGNQGGRAYGEVAALLSSRPFATHFILVPWLKTGGADLVVLKTVEAIRARGGNPVVMATDPATSPWSSKLPPDVLFVDLGAVFGVLSPRHRRAALARLVIQFAPEVVHIVNSRLAWEMCAVHGSALASRSRVFASLFCDDLIDADGVAFGFAHRFLLRCDRHLAGYVSDNATYPAHLSAMYGIDPAKFHVARVPTSKVADAGFRAGAKSVMWAGRLDRQKRPDLLLDVAESMPDIRFDVYGEPMLTADPRILRRLNAAPNVAMKGRFDGVSSLPTGDYGAFLYTSSWDGIPNILLEMAMRGLPIVASSVGGIAELISKDTGWLVSSPESTEGYVRAISEILSSPREAARRAAGARDLVCSLHDSYTFECAMAAVPGYFGENGRTDRRP